MVGATGSEPATTGPQGTARFDARIKNHTEIRDFTVRFPDTARFLKWLWLGQTRAGWKAASMVEGGVLGATISDTKTWSPQFMSDPMISAAGDGVAQAPWGGGAVGGMGRSETR
jgi:hypothetical protein